MRPGPSNKTSSIDVPALVVTLVVMGIVAFVGVATFGKIASIPESELREAVRETETVCGLGCGGTPIFNNILGVALVIVILAVVVAYLHGLPATSESDNAVEQAKTLYVEGEIDILELEDRLDDEIDEDDLEP